MFTFVLAAIVALPVAAHAQNATEACPPPFDGPYTLNQHLAQPRSAAGIEAGAFTAADVGAVFDAVDGNDNGLICVQDQKSADKAADASGRQYYYNIVDDHASAH